MCVIIGLYKGENIGKSSSLWFEKTREWFINEVTF